MAAAAATVWTAGPALIPHSSVLETNSLNMNFAKIIFFFFACFMAMSAVNAAPSPWNPFKELERAGQRVRNAVISAGPAVQTVAAAAAIAHG